MFLLKIFWIFIQFLIGVHLIVPFLLYLSYVLKRKLRKKESGTSIIKQRDYAIIVTAYRDVSNLHAVVASIVKSNYPNYLIYIVADNCDATTLDFNNEHVMLLRPEEILASNTGSHFYAIERFKRNHDCLTIIDSDNLVHPDYLGELNKMFDQGFEALQGIRLPKNLDTNFACLDAARDIYYHFYDGKLLFALGSSATLSGSGMAFTTDLYRECLEKLDIKGAGFDKVLQAEIVKLGKRIAFAPEAKVFDEKTTHNDQLVNQRARWINTWFRYFRFGFDLIGKGIKRVSINQLLFGSTLLRPPLFIFLILSFVFMIVNLWMDQMTALIWLGGFVCFFSAFALALIHSNTDKRIYRSLKNIPVFMFYQLISLLKIKNANKRSVATTHYNKSQLEEIIS